MSVYLPKIENYPLFDPDQLDTRNPTPKKKKQAIFPVVPAIDGVRESTVVPLPDIRINDGHAQSPNLPQTADDDLLAETQSETESARKENLRKRVTFGRKKLADIVEEKLEDGRTVSQRDPRRVFSPRRKRLVRQNSLGRLFRRIDSTRSSDSPSCERKLFSTEQIRRKFAQAIKAVISIRKLAAIMIKKSEEPSAMLQTFTDVIDTPDDFSENLRNQGLSFDPSYFKANKEISVSSEVKNILNLPPSSRTQEQIQTAMYGLQSLPSFAEYPLHMQEKLTKVAWYEKVPPKRTIIRQGHYAENFYFILSGQAVVTIMMYDPKTNESMPRTANFMRKGTSFGELALLHHSRRTATVTSHDTVQLLSIGREDFFDIFMSRQGTDEVPEHIRFISQLDFMKGWPIERLVEHPEHCLLHFFKRNVVIVQDSKRSDWLYIVKSGSCQVLKQLRGVTAKLGIRKYEGTLDERFHLPHTGPKVDTGLFRPRPRSHRSLAESCTSSEEDHYDPGGTNPWRNTKLSPLPSSHAAAQNGAAASSPSTSSKRTGRKFSKESYTGMPTTGKAHFQSTKATPPPGLPRLCGPRKQRPASLSPTSTPRSFPPPPPVFVQVSSLKPRDVFGLELVRFHDELDSAQTSVSLVSRGAECIMLSKDFFRKHANEMVKKNLQELVRPYPDEITFQESLQRKADWDLFKHKLIEDITSLPIT